MLKLIKYEFRKNRTALLAIGGGLLLLELYYLFRVVTFNGNEDKLAAGAAFLALYAIVCFFAVFILAVLNYSRELSSKSSYLIFMTPNSSYAIILSKLLSTLFLGIAVAAIFAALCIVDIDLYHVAVPESETFSAMLRMALESMGIPIGEILLNILTGILAFLADFFSIIALVYLAVTLSATFLQNSRLRFVLSIALFLGLAYAVSKATNMLPTPYSVPEDITEAALNALPAAVFNLAVLAVSIFACGKLLDKKVSL